MGTPSDRRKYWRDRIIIRDNHLFWRHRPESHFPTPHGFRAFNSRWGGKKVRENAKNGYKFFWCDGSMNYSHRVVWEYFNGQIPSGLHIDHVDHDRTNNKIENLRCVSQAENARNASAGVKKKNKLFGVFVAPSGNWVARITVMSRPKHLGTFVDFFEAACARKSAELYYEYHLNHGKERTK